MNTDDNTMDSVQVRLNTTSRKWHNSCVATALAYLMILLSFPADANQTCGAAGGEPKACAQTDAGSAAPSGINTGVQNPIDLITGNKYQQEVDYQRNAVSPVHELVFMRYYNSVNNKRNIGLGFGWSSTWHLSMGLTSPVEAQIVQSDGRRIVFKKKQISSDPTKGKYLAATTGYGYLTLQKGTAHWYLPDLRTLTFNTLGKLIRVQHPNGTEQRLKYNADQQLTSVEDSNGAKITLSYYPLNALDEFNADLPEADKQRRDQKRMALAGMLHTVVTPQGETIEYDYDLLGNLTTAAHSDGKRKEYGYDQAQYPHALTSIHNESGKLLGEWGYDHNGRANFYQKENGIDLIKLRYELSEGKEKTGTTFLTNSLGQTSTYTWQYLPHDHIGRLLSSEGPGCSHCPEPNVSYQYDNHYRVIVVQKLSHTLRYRYDDLDRVVSVEKQYRDAPTSHMTTYQYKDETVLPMQVATPSIKPGASHIFELSYRPDNSLESVTERGYSPTKDGDYREISRTTQYKDEEATTALLKESNKHVPPDGVKRKASLQDDKGRRWTLKYNAIGQLIEVESQELKVGYHYQSTNKLTGFTYQNAYYPWIDYDAAGRVIKYRAEDIELAFSRDSEGKILQKKWLKDGIAMAETNPLYNDQQKLIGVTNKQGDILSHIEYADDRPVLLRHQKGSLSFQYQHGLLSSVTQQDGTVVQYELGMPDRVASITDPNGNTTIYQRDDFGRVVTVHSPDKGQQHYEYDEQDRLIAKIDAQGRHVRFAYNASQQLESVTLPDESLHFTYESRQPESPITQLKRTLGNESWQYDKQGRVQQHTQTQSGKAYTTRYTYDDQGRLTRKQITGGQGLVYRYHENGQLASVHIDGWWKKSLVASQQVSDQKVIWHYANGINTQYSYQQGKLAQLRTSGINDYRYSYHPAGYLTGIDTSDAIYARYRYDSTGKLDLAMMPWAIYGYSYDANGNRQQKVVNGKKVTYQYSTQNNQVQHATNGAKKALITHDAAGNLQQAEELSMEYTKNGQLQKVYLRDKLQVEYRYNHRAERITKISHTPLGTQTTGYLYEDKKLVAELDENGRIIRQYLYAGVQPVAVIHNRKVYSIHSNHLGAPTAVTDEHGKLIWRADYAPFGLGYVDEDPDADKTTFTLNLRLPGQYYDQETGLHYNYYRYYDPEAGRYLSSDPLDLNAGTNTYAYVANNPIHNVDPLGLLLFAFDGTGNTNNLDILRDPKTPGDISNVVRFMQSYQQQPGELTATPYEDWNGTQATGRGYYYITGAGVKDPNWGGAPPADAGLGSSLPSRVRHMALNLLTYIESMQAANHTQAVKVDITGFSRGAASARMFANVVDDFLTVASSGANFTDPSVRNSPDVQKAIAPFLLNTAPSYHTGGISEWIQNNKTIDRLMDVMDFMQRCHVQMSLNFIGIFDTVPHYYAQDNDLQNLDLAIPQNAAYAAHAVALNEHRVDFAAVSIHNNANTPNSATRVESGFLGAHADIGGGYAEGDLPHASFMWMVAQAQQAGVGIDMGFVLGKNWHKITNPMVHSSEDVCEYGVICLRGPDREFKYMDGSHVMQNNWQGDHGEHTHQAEQFFNRQFMQGGVKGIDREKNRTLVGAVILENPQQPTAAIDTYQEWLKVNYGLDMEFNYSRLGAGATP